MYSYNEAFGVASDILESIEDLVQCSSVAGRLRRRKQQVHDIDIVLIPIEPRFGNVIIRTPLPIFPTIISGRIQSALGGELLKKGPKLLQMKVKGIQTDIYCSNHKQWGIHLLRWTGSRFHNIELCRRAQDLGLKLSVSEGLMRDGHVIASMSEVEIFDALQLPYKEPWERD